MPLEITCLSTFSFGLVFTAYKIFPGKFFLKNSEEIALLRESALIVSKTLGMLASEIKPGVTSLYLTVWLKFLYVIMGLNLDF